MNSTDEVLVVGAGPVGLTAACHLARLDVPVRVVDALAAPTTESRAVAVHPRSLEMLATLGIEPRLEELGRRIAALEMVDGRNGAVRARVEAGGVASRHPYLLDIAQPDTESVLAERAAELGVVVERGVRLTALVQDADGVEVTLRSGDREETSRVGWVVGADGGHSTTRDLVGAKLRGGFYGQHFAMADVDVDTAWTPEVIRMFQHPDGMGMLFPLAGKRARIMFFVEDPGRGAPAPTLEQMQALADARTGATVSMSNPRWLAHFEVHHAQVPEYRFGRVLLGGDAAHIHSPAGAQGMNTGMQDAANLAWKLAFVARGQANASLLDTYHDERHPVGAAVVRTTTMLTDVGTAVGPKAAIRDTAQFVLGHLPRLGNTAAANITETTIAYRDGALAVQHGSHKRGTARAGEHAPDPDGLTRPDGRAVTVEDLLNRPGILLLVREPGAELQGLRDALGALGSVVPVVREGGAGDRVVDPDDALGRAYGWKASGMALVRPDGYLGLVADSADTAVLSEYLTGVLRATQPTTV